MLTENFSLNTLVNRRVEFEGRFCLLNNIRNSFKVSKLRDPNNGALKLENAASAASEPKSMEEIETSPLYQWTTKKITEALTQCSICTEKDGLMLVEAAVLFGPKFLYNE